MKTYTTILTKSTVLLSVLLLSACSFLTAPKYDNNELMLLAYFKTDIDEANEACKSIQGKGRIDTRDLKRGYARLNNYAKQTPSNEDYVKMLKNVKLIMDDLDAPEYSRTFCDIKTKNVRRAVDIISQSSALKF